MPLPPLPNPAVIGDPAHIADSVKLTAYLRALAEQDAVDIDYVPDPDPAHGGHIEWHNAMVKAAKEVAAVIGAEVQLPPDVVKAKDLEHVTHHNVLRQALADMSAAVPFSVTGGVIYTGGGYRSHVFTKPGQLTVRGQGKVTIVACGGGGGGGWWESNYHELYSGGSGGGGCIYKVTAESDPFPVEDISSGTFEVYVDPLPADRGNAPTAPGKSGKDSTMTGPGISVTARGGGGGGSSDIPATSAGTGGGGGGYWDHGEFDDINTHRESAGAPGSPGGDGVKAQYYNRETIIGGGGGATGNAVIYGPDESAGGPGYPGGSGKWWADALKSVDSSRDANYIGAGGGYFRNRGGWGCGEVPNRPTQTIKNGPGFIIVAYPHLD